jgi:hypothetical protein
MAGNPININSLESMVTGLREVAGCRIVVDDRGEITDVYVTAVSERAPKLVARDVLTILKVRGGVEVDRRKIQVALLDPVAHRREATPPDGELLVETEAEPALAGGTLIVEEEEPPAADAGGSDNGDLPGGGAEIDDDAFGHDDFEELMEPRVLYEKLTVTHAQGRVTAAVELRRGERSAVGEVEAADTPDGHLAAVIHATLEALLMLFDTAMNFDTPRFDRLRFSREDVLVVHLEAVEDRVLSSYSGSAVIRQDPRQAAVLATLAATNRLVGRWVLRDALDFDIS